MSSSPPGECLPHDRRFALAQGDAPFDPAAPAWVQKRHFGCLMAMRSWPCCTAPSTRAAACWRSARPTARRCSAIPGPRRAAPRSPPSWPASWARRRAAPRDSSRRRGITSPMSRQNASRSSGCPACMRWSGGGHAARPAALPGQCLCLGRAALGGVRPAGAGDPAGRRAAAGLQAHRPLPGDRGEPGNSRTRRRPAEAGCGSISAMPTSASMPRCWRAGGWRWATRWSRCRATCCTEKKTERSRLLTISRYCYSEARQAGIPGGNGSDMPWRPSTAVAFEGDVKVDLQPQSPRR